MQFSWCLSAAALIASARLAHGGPSNLIASSDGLSVYFQIPTGVGTQSWFRIDSRGKEITPLGGDLIDVSDDGFVRVRSSIESKTCGSSGSTCSIAPSCSAWGGIDTPSWTRSLGPYTTFASLDRFGWLVWIEQGSTCLRPGAIRPPALGGLYRVNTGEFVAGQGFLANRRPGRRMITNSGLALVNLDQKLQLVGGFGTPPRPLPSTAPAGDAVIDANGCIVAYLEPRGFNGVHWLDCRTGTDELLGFRALAPALSDDGRYLVYLNDQRNLAVYDRSTRRSVTGLIEGVGESFSIGGAYVFAAIADGSLVKMSLADGVVSNLLPPLPQISSVHANAVPLNIVCPLPCYGFVEPRWLVTTGIIALVNGTNLNQSGWKIQVGDIEAPLHPVNADRAWFQVPEIATASTGMEALLVHPDLPGIHAATLKLVSTGPYAVCLNILHDDLARPVTGQDPALVGETIRLVLTGLPGVEPVPVGEPNPTDRSIAVLQPPTLADPGAADITRFELAPGLIGIQQADLLIRRAFTGPRLFSDLHPSFGCNVPPVAVVP